MSNYILDKAYTITSENGVQAYRVVVVGSNPGECQLPSAANDGKILGVTLFSQENKGRNVTVRKAGIARCVAAGAINLGDPVNIADSSGKVKAINESSGTHINCVGFAETSASADGDIIEVFLSFHERIVP
ncbi:DUF2190 family protein [Candidatus Sumerlaeota bacterium]|nr:DUF2190 family protein [Candidatus Sumerlaeota bacterium]